MAGQLRSTPAIIRRARPATPRELRGAVASSLDVGLDRVFLTHGATEAATLTLFYLGRRLSASTGRRPRAGVRFPEYPPLLTIAEAAGFVVHRTPDVRVISSPNNPTGGTRDLDGSVGTVGTGPTAWLVDETFREFTPAPSWSRAGSPGVWCSGSLTKVYGADSVRVGWIVAPPEEAEVFARFHGVVADGIPDASVAAGAALIHARSTVLKESRSILSANVGALRRAFPSAPQLSAPLWFDVGTEPDGGERLARAAANAGVLVCPGSYFGDPRGVRLTLTRRDFPQALAAYRAVRGRRAGFGPP